MGMTPKIRVLHVIKSLGRGGAERLLTETIQQHNKRFQFDVVYFLPWKNQMVKELEQLGCRVYLLPANKTLLMLWRIPSLVRLIQKGKYNLIHCHLPWAGIVGKIAGKLTGVPVVYTEHNNFSSYNVLTRWLHQLKFNWYAKVIAVSADAEQALRQALGARTNISVILNGVNTDSFSRKRYDILSWKDKLKIPRDKIIVSTVAVFRPQKRLDRWITIAEKIVRKYDGVFFIIIGDGLIREELMQQAQGSSLNNNLMFAGLVEDPRPFLACTDIYLMSSEFEGLPVALLEAMSMECLPVVTAVGGIPAVVDSTNGVLYDRNDIETASARIIEFAQDETKRKSYAEQARTAVSARYSMQRMVGELESTYDEVLQHNASKI